MRRVAHVLLLLSLAAGLVACDPPNRGSEVSFSLPVTVREVGTGTVEDRIVTTGTLRAPEVVFLRAETAALAAVAVLQSAVGDLAP